MSKKSEQKEWLARAREAGQISPAEYDARMSRLTRRGRGSRARNQMERTDRDLERGAINPEQHDQKIDRLQKMERGSQVAGDVAPAQSNTSMGPRSGETRPESEPTAQAKKGAPHLTISPLERGEKATWLHVARTEGKDLATWVRDTLNAAVRMWLLKNGR